MSKSNIPGRTPGPWEAKALDVNHFIVNAPNGSTVAKTQIPFGLEVTATIRANARLIASAPELYDALWVATEHNALHFGESHNTVIQGRAALAKATP